MHKYNLSSYELNHIERTSADGAGLVIAPLVIRYDEVASGEITHALRFAAPWLGRHNGYVYPARAPGTYENASTLPAGSRVRLKASYDISGFTPHQQVILTALKKVRDVL